MLLKAKVSQEQEQQQEMLHLCLTGFSLQKPVKKTYSIYPWTLDREDCPWVKGNPCPKSVNSSTHICSSFSGVISVVSPVGERRASGSNSGKVVQAVRRSGHYCNVCYPCWSLNKEDQGFFIQTEKSSRTKCSHDKSQRYKDTARYGTLGAGFRENRQELPTQTLIKTQ